MRDRQPTPGKENRVRITQDNGQVVEGVLDYADEATQEGSAYCKANVLPDAVCDALGVNRVTAEPKDALLALASGIPWQKIATFNTAGAFTWTSPDLNNGRPYEIGVFIIGGGGSGGTANTDVCAGATGGAAGETTAITMLVAPNTQYTGVVGNGGSGSNRDAGQGHAGGASSFSGKYASGGTGGNKESGARSYNIAISGATGGQASDTITLRGNPNEYAPCNGSTPLIVVTKENVYYTPTSNPKMAINPFAPTEQYLAAGGSASYGNSGADKRIQSGSRVTYGRSGDGAVSSSGGHAASGYGNGGGALCLNPFSASALSGAGSAGAVLIYARKAES